jgi:hypothetical protein
MLKMSIDFINGDEYLPKKIASLTDQLGAEIPEENNYIQKALVL